MTVHPISAAEARKRLEAGNARFVANLRSVESMATQARREQLAAGQSPYAVILSCSDSRVPSELVFDCGLGDLFVVRVAGNVVAPSIVGSVEFAAASFGTQLCVVVGPTRCGAVAATLDAIDRKGEPASPNLRDIVERIVPAVAELDGGEDRVRRAVRANVRASVGRLRTGSRILEERARSGNLVIAGAEYDLETGVVTWLD
jgi:carbonic anhydrase